MTNQKNSQEKMLRVVTYTETGPNTVRLKIAGHLDATGAPQLSKILSDLLEKGVREVELECSAVGFISSTGIGTLIAAIGEYRDVAGDVFITNLSNDVREVFEMLDLLDYVTVR